MLLRRRDGREGQRGCTHDWGSEQALVCGRGNDALLGPTLGKQGSRVEEGERRERDRESRERKRFDLKFSQKFSHELENLQKQKLFKI